MSSKLKKVVRLGGQESISVSTSHMENCITAKTINNRPCRRPNVVFPVVTEEEVLLQFHI